MEETSAAGEGIRGDPLSSSIDDPEKAVERSEVTRAIERCLGRLPEEFRTVVVLADVLALDYQEVAAAMGSPVGTVRSRLARARARLRECLESSRELLGREERLAEGTAFSRAAHPGEGVPKGRTV
jgi:RNA polymerase sigma-70 factor (ECF subfamily)